ncbi:MAG: hypothetical protein LBS62_12150 [Clostridiales bacterium]|jgi:hypothetical protein|nr:hypothetical protein [Clostridiales bacterium]
MTTILFTDQYGSVNSKRERFNGCMYKTSYPNEPWRGGNTFVGRYSIERYDNDGRLMCRGIKTGRRITYFDSDHRLLNGIARY